MIAQMRYAGILFVSAPIVAGTIVMGDYWVWSGMVLVTLLLILGDTLFEPDRMIDRGSGRTLYEAMLFVQLPISAVMLLLIAWQAAPGDLLGLGAFIQRFTEWPVLRNHLELSPVNKVGAAVAAGYLLSTNTVVAHELVHRTAHPISMIAGRWLLAVIGDTQFSISHVYGHHLDVGTDKDPATARRGESLYRFIPRSAWGQILSSMALEKRRLAHQGQGFWSLHNRFLRGQAMTASIAVGFYLVAGAWGLALYLISAAFSKALFETVNYIQHYGLVRTEGAPVLPRHSWDCSTRASSYFLFNLTRHAHHHADANVEYWKLEYSPEAVAMKYGYMATMLLAMVPPAWRRLTEPQLRHWDSALASTEEAAMHS